MKTAIFVYFRYMRALLTNWQFDSNYYELHSHARAPSWHLFILLCSCTFINSYFVVEQ